MKSVFTALVSLLLLATSGVVLADPGDPIAIRRASGGFAIETMWNLSIQLIEDKSFSSSQIHGVDVVFSPSGFQTSPGRHQLLVRSGQSFDWTLDRFPNSKTIQWQETSEVSAKSSNAIRVRAVDSTISCVLDGVQIVYIRSDVGSLSADERALVADADALIVASGMTLPAKEDVRSRMLISGNDHAKSNTVAIRVGDHEGRKEVMLAAQSLTLAQPMEDLMQAKEVACRSSQKVFEKLSTNQMNFRPSNGSHTPRWNTEHMMGRELLFFSQIFHAQDSSIPIIDLNPKQMPPDYVAKHADWSGWEEAQQMERVLAFTRRFAYLMQNLPLAEKPAGSHWQLRALLQQMDRHYSEHTANVEKKFELDDWPRE